MGAIAGVQLGWRRVRRQISQSAPARMWGRAVHDVLFRHGHVDNVCRGVYATFEEAARSAPTTRLHGYDHALFGNYYADLHDHPRPVDYPVLFWLRPLMPAVRRLFDFGGHVGVAYYAFRNHLQYTTDLRWIVCDVPSTVERGRTLAQARASPHLVFTTAATDGDGSDVLHASGSLQYLDAGFLPSTLRRYGTPPRHVLLNQTPLHPERTYFTLQCTGPAYHPYTIASRRELVADMAELGYELVDAWACPRRLEIPFHPGYELDAYSGLYFRRAAT